MLILTLLWSDSVLFGFSDELLAQVSDASWGILELKPWALFALLSIELWWFFGEGTLGSSLMIGATVDWAVIRSWVLTNIHRLGNDLLHRNKVRKPLHNVFLIHIAWLHHKLACIAEKRNAHKEYIF